MAIRADDRPIINCSAMRSVWEQKGEIGVAELSRQIMEHQMRCPVCSVDLERKLLRLVRSGKIQ